MRYNEANANAWYLYSYNDNTYIDNGGNGNSSEVKTSADKVNAQEFNPTVTGSGKFAIKSPSYCYGLAANHNGTDAEEGNLCIWGTVNDCKKFGVNVWYLHKVSDEQLELLIPTAHYWEVADEPSAPVSGKTYVIKNAVKDLYLIAGIGVDAEYNPLEDSAIWQLDETGTEVDGNMTWTLKSIEEDGYWKYINYDEQPGYDGYDWFGYAGMNAEFSTIDEAETFTILTPVQSAEKTRNSVKSDQAVVDGAYVLTAKEQIGGNWFKLDTQRETDAALEPWQDAPQWLFYEATPGNDLNKELQLALELYNFDSDNATTGDAPGYYDEERVAAYNDARDVAEGLDETATETDIRKAINDLRDAFAAVDEVNPIVEGWYSIVSAGKGPGYYTGEAPTTVIDEEEMFALYNANGLVSWKYYDESDYTQYYYFEQDDNGNWFVKSYDDETYINKGAGQYNTTISTSAEATTAQVFEPVGVPGKFTFKYDGNPYVYALTGSHNGSKEGVSGNLNIWGSLAEAKKFGMNVWFLRPVSEEQIEAAKEKKAAGLEDLIAQYEAENLQGSTAPGYYVQDNVDALNDLISEAKGLANAPADERLEAISNLKAAYNKATTEYNPVTEGYYTLFIDNAKIAENQKPEKAMFINTEAEDKALSWAEYDENDLKFIFKLTPADNGA